MTDTISRRDALKTFALAGGTFLSPLVTRPACAADALPHISANDPTAVALSYFEDASKVDPKKFPTYKPEQKCSTCIQLQGKAGDPWRPCTLFPGKLVNANGWCKVWVKKSG